MSQDREGLWFWRHRLYALNKKANNYTERSLNGRYRALRDARDMVDAMVRELSREIGRTR